MKRFPILFRRYAAAVTAFTIPKSRVAIVVSECTAATGTLSEGDLGDLVIIKVGANALTLAAPAGGALAPTTSSISANTMAWVRCTTATAGGQVWTVERIVSAPASPSTLTQTFATADGTHAARTGLALTDSTGGTADNTIAAVGTAVTGVDGTGSNAASKADVDTRLTAINANFCDLTDELNKVIADLADTAQFVNALADIIQAAGLAA